jgi:hypothetical protein
MKFRFNFKVLQKLETKTPDHFGGPASEKRQLLLLLLLFAAILTCTSGSARAGDSTKLQLNGRYSSRAIAERINIFRDDVG